MLESLEQTNIKRMSVERPEQKQELAFDPKKEITDAEWQRILEDMHGIDLNSIVIRVARIKFLDPSRLPSKINTEVKEDARGRLEEWKIHVLNTPGNQGNDLLTMGVGMKLLYPELNQEIRSGSAWQKVDDSIKDIMHYNVDNVGRVVLYKLIFPEKSPVGGNYRKEMIEATREVLALSPVEAITDIGYYRVLFPNEPSPIKFTEEDWELVKEDLHEKIKNNQAAQALHLAFYSMVAQAKKVEVTDKGLELKFTEGITAKEEPIPEQKQF